MKKNLFVVCLILALATISIAVVANTITIENPSIGWHYYGYKVFDASYCEYEDIASYTINSTSYWYDRILADDNSPFDLEPIIGTDLYNVHIKEGYESYIIDWFQDQELPMYQDLAGKTAFDVNDTVVWEYVPEGYYLITTVSGTMLTVLNATGDVVIIDKNQWPGWEVPEDPTDPVNPVKHPSLDDPQAGKNVSKDGEWYGKNCSAQVGDTLYFKINAYLTKYNLKNRVYAYMFTDLLGEGLSYNGDLVIRLDGVELTETEATVIIDEAPLHTSIIIDINAYTGFDDFPVEGHLEITYSAKVLPYDFIDQYRYNDIDMLIIEFDPTLDESEIEDNLTYPWPYNENDPQVGSNPPSLRNTIVLYGFALEKTNKNGIPLYGAEFKLYDNNMNQIKVFGSQNVFYVGDEDTEGDGVIVFRDLNTEVTVFGLDIGKYYHLEEVKAPAGFNMLTEPFPLYLDPEAAYDQNNIRLERLAVINEKGVKLPSTGGLGTKIFLAIGASTMLAAAIVFVVRKKVAIER